VLSIPQIASTRQISPYLYESLNQIVAAVNSLSARIGVDAAPASQAPAGMSLPAPAAPASISVTGARGIFSAALGASAGATSAALYFLEAASDPGFSPAGTTVYPLGESQQANISLGAVTRYFRARAKYPESDYSPYAVLGGSTPAGVSGGLAQSNDVQPNIPLNYTNNATVDSVDAGSSATARIYGPGGVGSSWTRYTGQGTATYPAGSVTGMAYSTVYYVVWTGSAYQALGSLPAAVSDSYVFAGKVTTVASGGGGGAPGGGGGGGGNGGRFTQ
jgi:hypothetical protein